MANLYITEYSGLAESAVGRGVHPAPVPKEPHNASQKVVFTSATQSTPFGSGVRMVRIVSDADCHVVFGDDPTADTDAPKLIADAAEFRGVTSGMKLSVVAS